jgi:hypothetical protein
MSPFPDMRRLLCVVSIVALVAVPRPAIAAPAMLFRIFLADGTDVVSYGEYARVGKDIVFSMAAGGTADDPRLQLVTLPAASVDWARTERYADAARADHYARTRGDEEFAQLSNEVARVLNDLAQSPDRGRALALGQRAHDVLAQWPKDHYHYRDDEIRDILAIVDSAVASLRGVALPQGFELALVASTADGPRDLAAGLPNAQGQVDQLMHAAAHTPRVVDRVALLHAALALLNDASSTLDAEVVSTMRGTITRQVEHESAVDAKYAQLSQRLLERSRRAASKAKVKEVERVLAGLTVEDRRLGAERPETVEALRAELEAQLTDARRLRLLRDQWTLRRSAYQDYQREVGLQLLQLVKARPLLEAIRSLDGPAPTRLVTLRARLSGGAERLQRLPVPPEMQSTHDLLVSAWRFAENAVTTRFDAINSGSVSTAWSASSAAAGALMLLTRAQDDIRTALEVPRLK